MKRRHGTTETRKHRSLFLKYLSVLPCFCVSVYGLGCQAAPKTGVVTVAVLSSPNSLDPRIGSDETSQRIHTLIYDYLLALDEQLRVVGGLAESWEQVDALNYIVKLRQGVRFHDGHELSADDVVYTF